MPAPGAAASPVLPRPVDASRDVATAGPVVLAAVLVLAFSLPFLGKAFNVDEPLFLWWAHRMRDDPARWLDFDANWYGRSQPFREIMMNPPGMSALLAAASCLVGWSELGLRSALLAVSLASGLGFALLARRLSARPCVAVTAGLLSPVVVVSLGSAMCDLTLLGLWCWTVYCWIVGIDERRPGLLCVACILATAACLTKYTGAALVPLMVAYGFMVRGLGAWLAPACAPLLGLAGLEAVTRSADGLGIVRGAFAYSAATSTLRGLAAPERVLEGLAYAGCAFLPCAAFGAAAFGRRHVLSAFALAVAAIGIASVALADRAPMMDGPGAAWIQFAVFVTAGLLLLRTMQRALASGTDAVTVLLIVWVLGVLLFASVLNWTNNARSNLVLVPAAAILFSRTIPERALVGGAAKWAAVAVAAAIALVVARGDAAWSDGVRVAANDLAARHAPRDRTLRFDGHWGFQHYLEERGGVPLDASGTDLARGDRLVLPLNNSNLFNLRGLPVRLLERRRDPGRWGATTMSASLGAGFYASGLGRLPFALGRVPGDQYIVVELVEPAHVGPGREER